MKRNALLFSFAILLTPVFAFFSSLPNDDRPAELLQSLVIGPYNVDIQVPNAYKLATHDVTEHQHVLGFVKDTESAENWTQYLSLHISTNTQASASSRITELQHYLQSVYPGASVLESDIDRHRSGYQDAHTTIQFKDEDGELVVAASYYSDSASLIGVEVSQRVKKSTTQAKRTAEKVARDTVRLKD